MEVQQKYVDAGLITLPDRTIYIADDPEAAMARSAALGKASLYENLPMQRQVAAQYDQLAEMSPDRITRIDIAGREQDAVYADVFRVVQSEIIVPH